MNDIARILGIVEPVRTLVLQYRPVSPTFKGGMLDVYHTPDIEPGPDVPSPLFIDTGQGGHYLIRRRTNGRWRMEHSVTLAQSYQHPDVATHKWYSAVEVEVPTWVEIIP